MHKKSVTNVSQKKPPLSQNNVWRFGFVTILSVAALVAAAVYMESAFVFLTLVCGLFFTPPRLGYVLWGAGVCIVLGGYFLGLSGHWLEMSLFMGIFGCSWLCATFLTSIPPFWRGVFLSLLMAVGVLWLITPFLGWQRPYMYNDLSALRTLQQNQVFLGWLVLGTFGLWTVHQFWLACAFALCLAIIGALLPFYMGIVAIIVGFIVCFLRIHWPRVAALCTGALWSVAVLGAPFWVRVMEPACSYVASYGIFAPLEGSCIHWQELLTQIDQHFWWGLGWGQSRFVSQSCVLRRFAFPHHALLQLWIEGGFVWVMILWAAGMAALISLGRKGRCATPFYGWMCALSALSYQGSLWDFGWLYGVMAIGIVIYRVCTQKEAPVDTNPKVPTC